MWSFDPPLIEVPMGSILNIYLASADVQHGFQILGTNVNLMAIPGAINYAKVRMLNVGNFPIVCHEYCGAGHQAMSGMIKVIPYGAQFRQSPPAPTGPDIAQTDSAKQLMQTKGCMACHSTDGTNGIAPTFKGIFGKTEIFVDGSSAKVDEQYLRESIRNPAAKIVKPYSPLMPAIPVSDGELETLVKYIRNLK
jgi:cytochrome c oxidase subunit 2